MSNRPVSASSFNSSWIADDSSALDEATLHLSDLSLGGSRRPRTALSATGSDWSKQLSKMAANTKAAASSNKAARSVKSDRAAATASSITCLSKKDCPLTIRLHLSNDAFKELSVQADVHKNYVLAARACVDCKPPKHAMHYAKRMRARKVNGHGL